MLQRVAYDRVSPVDVTRFCMMEEIMMTQLDNIKKKVNYLYSVSPRIHINVRLNHPRLELKNDAVEIKGVYKNIFTIEEYTTGTPRIHSLQYVDILTGNIEIIEKA